MVKNEKKSRLYFLFNSFKDKFIIILIVLAVINYFLSDALSTYIILGIAVISALIRYFQDYSVYKFNQELKAKMYTTTNVVRGGKEKEIRVEKAVPGDIVHLSAGSMIPADIMLIDSKDLFVNQSVFTGESVPVEKVAQNTNDAKEIFSISNVCLMGSSVVSGRATGVVIDTGFTTYLGRMSKEVETKKEPTNFEKGMNNITKMLIRYMLVVSIAVFVIYGFIRKDWLEAILFALSVAVGITPSMLPMIVNVNLTRGTKVLAKKKTLVKNINSIQNLGAIDVLCTDKTGTLTEDKIVLQKYIDVNGNEDTSILEYAYLNSYYSTGMKNIVDRAIMIYGSKHNLDNILPKYEKIDEIRSFPRSDYFYLPGKILHVDGDKEYLERCLEFYKKANVLAFGVYSPENQMPENIEKYLEDINPDIVVITGHDSKIKNNSTYFCEAVKCCRKYQKDYDKLIIIAGACQSEYENLIKSGANFASSPKKINIHALDPAIIALCLSLTDKDKQIDLLSLLEKTSNGKDGMGGVKTKGVMTTGYPR